MSAGPAIRRDGIVTLTTDYGRQDGYVGALKGAILSSAPTVHIVDISHDIPPHDRLAGAVCVLQSARSFPLGCVHLVVVDPEVGSGRAGLIVSAWQQWFVAPDSGVLHFALTASEKNVYKINALEARKSQTTTFDGRDWFGPVAARLAAGESVSALAEPTDDYATLKLPPPVFEDYRWVGHALHIDRFGNIVSNLPSPPAEAHAKARVFVGDRPIGPIRKAYSEVDPGKPVATIGALETVEAGIHAGSGQMQWQTRRGQKFEILFPDRIPTPAYPPWEPKND